ncbi:MAG: iron uptake porin [Pleurocapsa sp. MO_226.B13]|nr:iron uptake porin [Pleurocapsa sp. MO_226.B13]
MTIFQKFLARTFTNGIYSSSLLFFGANVVHAEIPKVNDLTSNSPNLIQAQNQNSTLALSQITNVNELRDVSPNDWAYEALRNLANRYGCISGYPDGTFQGDRALTRWEFAAALNNCIKRIERLIVENQTVEPNDLSQLNRLARDFEPELAQLKGRVEQLEGRTASLEDNQFSTTTKLRGQVIMSANVGGFDGDRIIDPSGRQELANSDPEVTFLYRAGLDFTTSFVGTDSLLIRLEGASGSTVNNFRGVDNAAATLEPFFGSQIDYAAEPPTEDGDFGIGRLAYTFKPISSLSVSLGPDIRSTDYVDRNSYANLSFLDFSSELFVNNLILFPVNGPAAGAAVDWKPHKAFAIRGLYAAPDASNPGGEQTRPVIGAAPFTQVLYPQQSIDPNTAGDRGLFGDTYQGTVEAEYSPSRSFALRLQYSGGKLFDNSFDVVGTNLEFSFTPKFGIFARYGYGSYDETTFGDIDVHYWMAGIGARDLFREGALAGIAVGQPFTASEVGDATQTNFEIFYNYPLGRRLQITPSVQVITNPGNQDSNGTITTGTLRTVFSF